MMIYTGYFAQTKKYREAGLCVISIARFNPPYQAGLTQLLALAPTAAMLKMGHEDYMKHFHRLLAAVDPQELVRDLERMSSGRDVILLCYESPGKYCHRHTVAEWLRRNAIKVQEFELLPPEKAKKLGKTKKDLPSAPELF